MPGARVPLKSEVGKGTEYAYVEVMACPGGCTNGGGQVKGSDVREDVSAKEWLGRVDEAYFSMSEAESEGEDRGSRRETEEHGTENEYLIGEGGGRMGGGEGQKKDPPIPTVRDILTYWSTITGLPIDNLAFTSYRNVESEVGKVDRSGGQERVVELAGRIGGGW